MQRHDAESLAEIRGQIAVLVNWCGNLRWFMSDLRCSTVDYLAQSAGTDHWEDWTSGKIVVFDAGGQALIEAENVTYDWTKTPQPIEFRRMA